MSIDVKLLTKNTGKPKPVIYILKKYIKRVELILGTTVASHPKKSYDTINEKKIW